MRIECHLPVSPSTNTYWRRNGNRYFVSESGVKYKALVRCAFGDDFVGFGGHCRLKVTVHYYPKDKRVCDLDNRLKGLLDALMEVGVFEDDSQIDDLRIVREAIVPKGLMYVVIEELEQVVDVGNVA